MPKALWLLFACIDADVANDSQLSLSYDNGGSFRVIKSMIGGCPLQTTYDFTIPSYMPAGNALLAWTWQNKVGNREFYMNCAEVSIESGYSSRKQRREAATNFDALPYLWRANLDGLDNCQTEEGSDPVYPNPGPDVEYGDDISSESSPTSGECDAPMPYGQAYRASIDAEPTVSFTYDPSTSAEAAAEPTDAYVPPDQEPGLEYPGGHDHHDMSEPDNGQSENEEYGGPDINAQARVLESSTLSSPPATTSQTYSTTTVYADCPDTITLTIYPSPSTTAAVTSMPSQYITSAQCTGTSASCPCARGFACDEISPCTWACNAQPTPPPASTRSWSHTRSTSWTTTTRATQRPTTRPSPNPPPQPTNRPPYATGNANRYLPCVPGTFVCTSPTTWETCNWNGDGSAWVYGYGRQVADGMMCLTSTSPYSAETDEYAQQALTPAGYYRDDRIVRERPDGDCDVDGAVLCTDGGQRFSVCDHGGWVRMGSVAEGTVCRDGRMVAA